MTVYYSRGGGQVEQLVGFGSARRSDARHRVEVADVGMLNIYRERGLGEKLVVEIPFEQLHLGIGTYQFQTGGGWIGGGSGLFGILSGVAQARMLNAITTRHHEVAYVFAGQQLPNGARRSIVLSFRIVESALRDELIDPICACTDAYVAAALAGYLPESRSGQTIEQRHAIAEGMHERGLLDSGQAFALRTHASQPFVDTLVARLRSGGVDTLEAQRVMHRVDDMHASGQLSREQVAQVEQLVRAILSPSAPRPAEPREWPRQSSRPRLDDAKRVELLQTLARLRRTGALTEAEYEDERRRISGQ